MQRKSFIAVQWFKRIMGSGGWRVDVENSALILMVCTLIGLLFYVLGLSEANIITIYILGILLISSVTSARVYGIASSVVGVLLFNCLFAEPRFTLFFFDPQYTITAFIMLAAALITSSVMLSFREQSDRELALYKDKERIAREAEEERLRANLLRTVSHDLRTPLAGIAGSADILLSGGELMAAETRRQMYQSIYDDAAWLTSLTENLLFVTRLENGPIALNMQPELLQEILPEALRHLNRRGKNQQISLTLPEQLLLVRADARLLMQVIVNMVDNAIKYSPAASAIEVRTFAGHDQAVVEVADNGPGIADSDKAHIFGMFYTTGTGLSGDQRGVGLGLSLCKSIIEAHDGEIYVRDNQPGGTIVGFRLKLAGMY